MQSKRKLAQLSRYRAVLREAIDELAELIQVGYERKPMVKGTVYELARKCGKAGCACTRGQLHRSMVLSWSEEGRTRLFSIPAERVKGLREKSERYIQYRAARVEVTRVHRRILKLLDQIEMLRRRNPDGESGVTVFERNDRLVCDAFRDGEFDSIEAAGEVSETAFFRAIASKKILEKLAGSYPTPLKKH